MFLSLDVRVKRFIALFTMHHVIYESLIHHGKLNGVLAELIDYRWDESKNENRPTRCLSQSPENRALAQLVVRAGNKSKM